MTNIVVVLQERQIILRFLGKAGLFLLGFIHWAGLGVTLTVTWLLYSTVDFPESWSHPVNVILLYGLVLLCMVVSNAVNAWGCPLVSLPQWGRGLMYSLQSFPLIFCIWAVWALFTSNPEREDVPLLIYHVVPVAPWVFLFILLMGVWVALWNPLQRITPFKALRLTSHHTRLPR